MLNCTASGYPIRRDFAKGGGGAEGQASILTLEGDSGLRRVLRNYSVCNY